MKVIKTVGRNLALGMIPLVLLQACGNDINNSSTAPSTGAIAALASVKELPNGVVVSLASSAVGEAKNIRLQVVSDKIIHITSIAHDDFNSVVDSLMVLDSAANSSTSFKLVKKADSIVIKTSVLSATSRYLTVKCP